jgi:hypothetical protein
MVAVLQLIGQGLEEPSVVARLLDVAATPCKPVYTLASEVLRSLPARTIGLMSRAPMATP